MDEMLKLFDRDPAREGTGCEKWDDRAHVFGRGDVMPLWVADMDFRAPAEVIAAMKARSEHGVFGYRCEEPKEKQAVIDWMIRRHGLIFAEEDILFSPGVVVSLYFAMGALLKPGSLVAVQPPVYGTFYRMIERAGMETYLNPLLLTEDGYKMDLNGLEDGLKKGVKALILCNPHNPVGRVFTREELRELSALLNRYDARLISDEIHGDIVMPGHTHVTSLEVDPNSIALISPTKTFGLAGLKHSSILVKDADARKKIENRMNAQVVPEPNLFGIVAQTAAYRSGDKWLNALLAYLDGTRSAVNAFFKEELPDFPLSDLQGTYLQWVDARALNLTGDELVKFFVEKAGVGLTGGLFFGADSGGFLRINLATRREYVLSALGRMKEAVIRYEHHRI